MSAPQLALAIALALAAGFAPPAHAETNAQELTDQMATLKHAIAIETVEGKDQVPVFAKYLADKLEAGGFAKSDIQIIPVGHTAALVVRYPGSGKGKPILLSAHMDVVAATNPGAWKHPPFQLTRDGAYLYGRGVADMKSNTVALVETFLRLKREGFVPSHDLILLASGDEETAMASTAELAKRYHDAEFLLNADAGGGTYDANLNPVVFRVQAAEKTYADFLLTVTSPGGHSSEPDVKGNAIYRLARALDHVAAYPFPVRHNAITLASLQATGAHTTGPLAEALRAFAAHPDDAQAAATISADPAYVGQIRTTCIATLLDAGDARNALPKRASANINCRIFPGVHVAQVEAQLVKAIDDPSVKVAVQSPAPVESPASPINPRVMAAVAAAVHARFPGVEIVPGMSSGATDSMYFRNLGVPCYGVAPEFAKPNDTHAHGVDEKLLASEEPAILAYWHTLLTTLAR